MFLPRVLQQELFSLDALKNCGVDKYDIVDISFQRQKACIKPLTEVSIQSLKIPVHNVQNLHHNA